MTGATPPGRKRGARPPSTDQAREDGAGELHSGNIKDASGIIYRKARLQNARPFRWTWDQRILLGYLNLLIGVEGVGKGTLVAWILARITRGELPGHLRGVSNNVAIIGDEDSYDHVWVPRLHAAGANLDCVVQIVSGPSGVVDVREDADALYDFIKPRLIRVLYFDQLLDNLGYVDSWKDKQVRDALAPLRRIVAETESAGLLTMHPNKRTGSFRDRVSGTPAFNALSRSSLLVAKHPHEADRRVAVRAKGNYNAEPPAFEFLIEGQTIDNQARGKAHKLLPTNRICDERETDLRAEDILEAKVSRQRDDSKVGQARLLLADMLADGETRPAKEVQDELFKQHGLPRRLATQAAIDIGVRKEQRGFPAVWYWTLPQRATPPEGDGSVSEK